jgi:hypothetical protein
MKRIIFLHIIIILYLLPIQQVNAQYYFYDNSTYNTPLMYEFGGSLGVMNCLTDVGGKKGLGKKYFKDLNIGNNQLNGSIYFGAMYKEAVGLRIEGTFGKIKAYDSILKNVTGVAAKARYDRNLSFIRCLYLLTGQAGIIILQDFLLIYSGALVIFLLIHKLY